jgi:hypothetical protein
VQIASGTLSQVGVNSRGCRYRTPSTRPTTEVEGAILVESEVELVGPHTIQCPNFQPRHNIANWSHKDFNVTQRSIASQWPHVVSSLPKYLDRSNCVPSDSKPSSGGSVDGLELLNGDSGNEWLGEDFDFVESDSSDGWEGVDDSMDEDFASELGSFEEWASSPSAFRAVPLTDEEFHNYYGDKNWDLDHVKLIGPRQAFSGPTPGMTCEMAPGVVPILGNFWHLYWNKEVLQKICNRTNLYARQRVGKPKPSVLRQTNGRKDWVPCIVPKLEAWIGILLIMGVKKERQIHNYWQHNEEVLRDPVIPRVMSLNRWEAINRCIHLVDNHTVETNSSAPRYDVLAKTRWLIEYFNRRSKELYNPEPMITVDELVVPYKGKYARIR